MNFLRPITIEKSDVLLVKPQCHKTFICNLKQSALIHIYSQEITYSCLWHVETNDYKGSDFDERFRDALRSFKAKGISPRNIIIDLFHLAPNPASLTKQLHDLCSLFGLKDPNTYEYSQNEPCLEFDASRRTIELCASRQNPQESAYSPHTPLHARPVFDHLEQSLILIGSSTGGPAALAELLRSMPVHSPPIVIVQHIHRGFSNSLAANLSTQSNISVVEAVGGEPLKPGKAYLAPGDHHLRVGQRDQTYYIELDESAPVNNFRPSVDVLFQSVAALKPMPFVAAALLTGMGVDGAAGLKSLREKGAYTIAQDEDSSVVYGMPKRAKELGGTCIVCPLDQISRQLSLGLRQVQIGASP